MFHLIVRQLLLIAGLSLVACTPNNDTPPPTNQPPAAAANEPAVKSVETYYIYANLGGYNTLYQLQVDGQSVSGYYTYLHQQKLIALEGSLDAAQEHFQLKEYYQGQQTGLHEFKFNQNQMTGNWRKADGAPPLELTGKLFNPNIENAQPKTPFTFAEYELSSASEIYNIATDRAEPFTAENNLKVTKVGTKDIFFTYHVEGVNAHTGDLDGRAEKTGDSYTFSDGEECQITFQFLDKQAITQETNCSYYRGMRAHFSSTLELISHTGI